VSTPFKTPGISVSPVELRLCIHTHTPHTPFYLQERLRAQELALRERETQELLKSGIMGSTGGWA
jgi:hypothetical protein